jgi:hypothetical protein
MNLTESEIRALDGLPLRAAVAEYVFGIEGIEILNGLMVYGSYGELHNVPHFERDGNAMLQVFDEIESWGCRWDWQKIETGYRFRIIGKTNYAIAESANKLTCVLHAALLYVLAQGESER